MIDQPQPGFERTRGQRGDTTQTYVRRAQDRADLGRNPAGSAAASGATVDEQPGGILAFLGRLWPFKRTG